MLKTARSVIRLRGVRHNNLKNFDLDLPLNRLIVVTGLSGSGKSSLAFDTLFAEGQRRYIETFSPYARQFLDRMDKPAVDSIEGIPPAIAIEQRNAVRTTRSTVGTMTEICDYLKMLWPHVAQLYCRQCGRAVLKDSPQMIWETLRAEGLGTGADGIAEVLITFDLPLTEKLPVAECLALVSKQGYQRLLSQGEALRLDEAAGRIPSRVHCLTVIQDRLKLAKANRPRFVEACEQAYHFGKGKLAVYRLFREAGNTKLKTKDVKPFSNRFHCAQCDLEYQPPSAALFSFNHPVGACPTCRGFGRIISIDYNLTLPDRSKTLAQVVVRPWQSGVGAQSQTDLMRMCRHFEIPTNVPFEKLPKKWQDLVINGEPDYGKDEEHEWPRAWYGIKGYFRWLESKAYKMHVRVLLSRYRAYTPCPDCHGTRFKPEVLLYRVSADNLAGCAAGSGEIRTPGLTLADFYQLPIRDALRFTEQLEQALRRGANGPLDLILSEVRSRLGYLNEVGLGYLTLDRPTRSLSGGETERVNLTTCLGTRLVNTLFVLDEPSVGLHPRDTERLVRILQQLRDAGNTVMVVEHEPGIMRAADQLVDLGPGHGASGGRVVFQGPYSKLLEDKDSLTGQYLSGRKRIEIPARRPTAANLPDPAPAYCLNEAASPYLTAGTGPNLAADRPLPVLRSPLPALTLSNASCHNLKNLTVRFPLNRLVCITGVSGSGKTTLVRDLLLPALNEKLRLDRTVAKASDRLDTDPDGRAETEGEQAGDVEEAGTARLEGFEELGRVALVDQSILGKTPRSNPAVYIGAFEHIREFFAQSDLARQRGLNASAFSFNSSQGQCERCRGAGFEKIEMQFLSDVFIRCPDCGGRRYRAHILQVKISSPSAKAPRAQRSQGLSIADLLDSTVEEVIEYLGSFPDSRAAQRAVESLALLQEVGLGYLKLGQPINTLSGGESQRLKLVRELAEAGRANVSSVSRSNVTRSANGSTGLAVMPPTLYLFDEPTTGLHFDDVRLLLGVFQRLVDAGHSVLVIEHNLEVIKCADWVIDLGPEAGDLGGRIVAQGSPEEVAGCPESHTGQALREVLLPACGGAAAVRYSRVPCTHEHFNP